MLEQSRRTREGTNESGDLRPAATGRVRLRRRELFVMAGALAGGLSWPGCASRRPYLLEAGSEARRRFVPLQVSSERIIRRDVGLRPFRPSGFVIAGERVQNKLLIHNYGHGGAGVTLSWGTAELALEEWRGSGAQGPAAVLGAGVIGLSTARLLQQRGVRVTIYARALPPDTTSNVAGASWHPSFVAHSSHRTPEFDQQLYRAARLAHRHFQRLVGPRYGVRWIEQYYLSDDPPGEGGRDQRELSDLYPKQQLLTGREHPFASRYAFRNATMLIEPASYLRALMDDFQVAGGRFVIRDFQNRGELSELSEEILFNCTGLGSRQLFGDSELVPMKGQLTVLMPQAEIDYIVMKGNLYMFPRSDGILLGGTTERGVWTLEPDLEQEASILAGHREIFEGMS